MIIGVEANSTHTRAITIGTHNGEFHCDEVVGIAILEIAHNLSNILVVRTRDTTILEDLDIVIDVGGKFSLSTNRFDHHMKDFNERRITGELYASAGLIWRDYGAHAIRKVLSDMDFLLNDNEIREILEEIDREVILPVDLEDNGEENITHIFSFIPYFLPLWTEEPNYNDAFKEVEKLVSQTMYNIIKAKIAQIKAKFTLDVKYAFAKSGILEIPSQRFPWKKSVIEYNSNHDNAIKFVIFPYPDGGWAAQCVPPSVDEMFKQLIPFPKEWAGGNLPGISGIPDAVFCHNGRFFARAKSKESIIEMCRIAMQKK